MTQNRFWYMFAPNLHREMITVASFVTLPDGRVRAFVRMKGHNENERFETKTQARAWATKLEAQIIAGHKGEIPDRPFRDALEKYASEVSPGKKGERWEVVRLNALQRDPLADVRLPLLSTSDVAAWRDRRLLAVSGESVRREWNLLQSVCSRCVSEWKWLKENPFTKNGGVVRPKGSKPRDEVFTDADLDVLRRSADTPAHRRLLRVLEFALETAMRSSEIITLGYEPGLVDVASRVATLPDTKNGTTRQVPLTMRAIELWQEARAAYEANLETEDVDGESKINVWGLTDATRDAHWRDLRSLAATEHPPVKRLHFHDTRHTWITKRAAEGKLTVIEVAAIVGHKNLNELLTYFNPSAAALALKL